MNYCLYIFFGVLPCIIWLLYYLRKDVHPESARMVLQIFLCGVLIAPIVAIIECIPVGFNQVGELSCLLRSFFINTFSHPLGIFLYMFLAVAAVEEIFKYLVVRFRVLKNQEFDEPLDVMLYMIIVALGFAALENILLLFGYDKISDIVTVSIFRFLGAVLLHTLCSGTIGYFLALSFFETKKRFRLTATGFILAISLHGLYNFSIIEIEGSLKFIIPILILISLTIFVTLGFRKLKKLKSVCKLK